MKSFDTDLLQRLHIPHHLILTIGNIRESKGRAALYKQQQPQALQTLQQAAVIQSTESSNRIEGITAPLERIKALVEEKTTPQNRSEQEIVGYRNVLNTIHANYENIPFTANIIRQFHHDMLRHLPESGKELITAFPRSFPIEQRLSASSQYLPIRQQRPWHNCMRDLIDYGFPTKLINSC